MHSGEAASVKGKTEREVSQRLMRRNTVKNLKSLSYLSHIISRIANSRILSRTRFCSRVASLADRHVLFFFSFEHRPNPMCYFGARLNCLACHSALVVSEENRLEEMKKGKGGKKNVWGSPFNVVQQKDHPERSAELIEGS